MGFTAAFSGRIFFLLWMIPLTVVLSPSPAKAAEPIHDVIAKLQARYEAIAELQADFNQVTEFKGFSKKVMSSGKFYLKKEKLRWDYLEPSRQQIFVEEDEVLFYVPEHQQVIKTRLSTELDSQVPVRLLAGSSHLERDFNIDWVDAQQHKDADGTYRLSLVPKTPTAEFAEIRIAVDPNDMLIRKIFLQEPRGNRSTFEFSNIKINRGLKDQVFQFAVPEGVVVVEQP
jgi:outer membrane lipoprotein carrier protein